LQYTARGTLDPSSEATAANVLEAAAAATDVFVFSHGWWNNPATAECRYRAMISGLRKSRPAGLTGEEFRPVLVGIYWPSAVFPMEEAGCDSISAPRDETLETSRDTQIEDSSIREWAAAAFPSSNPSQRARVAALLVKRSNDQALTAPESRELVMTLLQWRDAETPPDEATEGPVEDPFGADADTVARTWATAENATTENERFRPTNWLNFANAFSFWAMKDRAGIVGSRGVFNLLHNLQDLRQRGLRLHLIGHSFGAKLVTGAITGRGPGVAANRVDSLVLLQGAFSHFAFATADEIKQLGIATSRGGVYASVVSDRLVEGPIVATFSRLDDKNRFYYPAAVLVRDDFLEAARVSKYGSIGADGIQGPAAEKLTLSTVESPTLMVKAGRPALFSVDASDVVKGHSDLAHDGVFRLIWTAVEASRALR
jgi:hypothetical protein